MVSGSPIPRRPNYVATDCSAKENYSEVADRRSQAGPSNPCTHSIIRTAHASPGFPTKTKQGRVSVR